MGVEQSDLTDQVALITGGAGAIGRAIGEGLVKVGARIVLVDIDEDRLAQFEQELIATYGHGCVLCVVADVSDSRQVKQAFELAISHFGRLDILVNNAAVTQIKAVDTLSDADIDIMIDTNLKGYIKCAREAVRLMKESGTKGSLLFISSKNGLVGASNKSLYCASKGGELALARALAKELGVFGIRVNTICPDAVLEGSGLWEDDDYRLGTARRYGISEEEIPDYYKERCALKTNIQPEDVANAALFLVSNKAAKITGAILTVDGGVAFVR
jgi:NAD(P)-dependent dehydrogenase (short-subunit alcohol dehydrogenase family)